MERASATVPGPPLGLIRKRLYRVLAGAVFLSEIATLKESQAITIDRDSGIIVDIRSMAVDPFDPHYRYSIRRIQETSPASGPSITFEVTEIDLRNLTVLPGFVDVHVHFFLHPYSETSWHDQVTRESLEERTIRATVHARETLLAGFTTVRDLGTEGALDADISLRKYLSGRNPIIPGPGYYCSTRGIVTTGSYGPKSTLYPAQDGVEGITGAEVADGKENCVRAVRRQVGAGADWIKIYADYRVRSRMSDVSADLGSSSVPTFSKKELRVMIETAHSLGVKVAAHATIPEVVKMLLDLEVDSIEHGGDLSEHNQIVLKLAASNKSTWVPTLAACYTASLNGSPTAKAAWRKCIATFKDVISRPKLPNIACGGDTGVFAHGQNALEMALMRKLGAKWNHVLQWATYGGWRLLQGPLADDDRVWYPNLQSEDGRLLLERHVPFGDIQAGWAADLVGVEGRLDGWVADFENAVRHGVRFVMKGGVVYRNDTGALSLNDGIVD